MGAPPFTLDCHLCRLCLVSAQTALYSPRSMMLGHLPAKSHLLRATTNVRAKAFPKPQGTCLLTPTSPRHVTARPYSSSSSSPFGVAASSHYKSSPPALAPPSVLLSPHPRVFAHSTSSRTPGPSRRTYTTNAMASIKVGDTIPQGSFKYVPWSAELESNAACGIRAYLLLLLARSLRSDRRAPIVVFRGAPYCPRRKPQPLDLWTMCSHHAEHRRVEGQESRPCRRPRRVHRTSSLAPVPWPTMQSLLGLD